jgi:hypothetical protein
MELYYYITYSVINSEYINYTKIYIRYTYLVNLLTFEAQYNQGILRTRTREDISKDKNQNT